MHGRGCCPTMADPKLFEDVQGMPQRFSVSAIKEMREALGIIRTVSRVNAVATPIGRELRELARHMYESSHDPVGKGHVEDGRIGWPRSWLIAARCGPSAPLCWSAERCL